MAEKKKKVSQCKECKDGHHTFIVTRWHVSSGYKKAIHMRCQHCLEILDVEEIGMKEWRESEGI